MLIINQYNRGQGSGGETIVDKLLADGRLVAYYDAKPANVTVDASRNVSQLNDLSGNGYHLIQPTAARRPAYDGANRINFVAGSQETLYNLSIVDALQSNSIGIYGAFQSTSNDAFLVCFGDSDGSSFMGLRQSTTLFWGGTGLNGNTGIAMNQDNALQVFGLQVNNDSNIDVMENTSITTVTDATTNVLSEIPEIDNLTLGSNGIASPTYRTFFFEQLYITNGKLTTEELEQLAQYITTKTQFYQKILVAELGQSNMEGRDGDSTNPLYPFSSGKGKEWTGTNEIQIATTRGGASVGSHANYFCEKYFDLTNKVSVMIECATGGTGLTATASDPNWSSSSSLRGEAETKINSALTYYSRSVPDYALWCQGESDAQEMDNNPSYTKAIVKAAMQDVINWWQTTYPGVPFIISQTGRSGSGDTQGWQDMRAIQEEIALENEGVYIGFSNAVNFPAQGKMTGDNLHYNYIGLKEMGEALATFIVNNL